LGTRSFNRSLINNAGDREKFGRSNSDKKNKRFDKGGTVGIDEVVVGGRRRKGKKLRGGETGSGRWIDKRTGWEGKSGVGKGSRQG